MVVWNRVLLGVSINQLNLRLDLVEFALIDDLAEDDACFRTFGILDYHAFDLVLSEINDGFVTDIVSSGHDWDFVVV